MKPLISVLCPTRGRVPVLDAMINSLYATVDHAEAVEVLYRVDYDDEGTLDYLRKRNQQVVLGPHWSGYAHLARMINQLARLASADLLIVINDDVEFRTQGWERLLFEAAAGYPDGIFDLGVNTVMNNPAFVFPCQSRRQVNILGCFYDERLIYTDIWLRDVLMPFGRAIHIPQVTIQHNWMGPTEEQNQAISMMQQDSTYAALYDRCVEEGRQKIEAALRKETATC